MVLWEKKTKDIDVMKLKGINCSEYRNLLSEVVTPFELIYIHINTCSDEKA